MSHQSMHSDELDADFDDLAPMHEIEFEESDDVGTAMEVERATDQSGQVRRRTRALGLGAMGMSDFYGPANETGSRATLCAALDAGITFMKGE
jgi:hypothetical protein